MSNQLLADKGKLLLEFSFPSFWQVALPRKEPSLPYYLPISRVR